MDSAAAGPLAMETRSGMIPHTGTSSSVHHSTVASRSLVPSRAEQITTPAGMLLGVISSVATTRFGSTPPARVGMTTASARPRAACTTCPRPAGCRPRRCRPPGSWPWSPCAPKGPRPAPPLRRVDSNHSAEDPCGSASTRRPGRGPGSAATAARYTAVVVLPTPPLTLLTTMFIARDPLSVGCRRYGTGRRAGRSRQQEPAESAAGDDDADDRHRHQVGHVAQQDQLQIPRSAARTRTTPW